MADSDDIARTNLRMYGSQMNAYVCGSHDGRSIGIPLWWYPRLLKANAEATYELSS